MSARSRAVISRRASVVGIMVLVAAFAGDDGRSIARAQGGRAPDQRPAQGTNAPGILNPYAALPMRGSFAPYLVRDPTADERATVAGGVYGAILDEWALRVRTSHGQGGAPPDVEDRSGLELIERLGPWSLRWQEAQDNAAKSRAARYQALSDHLRRMSDLEQGRFWRGSGRSKVAGGPAEPKPPRISAEAARFFRPIDGWGFDRIVLVRLQSERPLNPVGVAVTPADQVEIAGWVYHAILDDAVGRFLGSPREGATRRGERAIFDALLAERLGFWSDLCSQSQDAADRAAAARSPAARVSLAGVRSAGGRTAAIRAHVERMRGLEDGRFVDDVLKRAGRPAVGPVDMTGLREFTVVARFFRIEAEDWLPGGSGPRDADVMDSGQAVTASRIYRAVLDGAARRYREAPRAGGVPADVGLVFDSRLAERLAAWSARWARAQIRADGGRASQFTAVRSHVERMATLEDGRSLRAVLERPVLPAGGIAALAPPREFADVARFFRLEALWELEQIKAR
jgi:hypothetical protein